MTSCATARPWLTARYAEILKGAKDFGAKMVVIDTAADTRRRQLLRSPTRSTYMSAGASGGASFFKRRMFTQKLSERCLTIPIRVKDYFVTGTAGRVSALLTPLGAADATSHLVKSTSPTVAQTSPQCRARPSSSEQAATLEMMAAEQHYDQNNDQDGAYADAPVAIASPAAAIAVANAASEKEDGQNDQHDKQHWRRP
jgi:hypothetical protein